MKHTILLLIAVLVFVPVLVAEEQATPGRLYQTETNILYRTAAEVGADAYIQERCRLDLYYPVNRADFATVVWFHGGGLTGGEKSFPEAFKNRGFAIVAVNYRLSPKVSCPAYIEDAAAAVAWTFKHIGEYQGDPNKIYVAGHSAGGYLTAMIGLDKSYLAKYGINADKIAALFPYSGQVITHFTIRKERGISEKQPIIDHLAPLYHVRADAPPLILTTGGRAIEMLGRYEENAYLARMMKIAGHTKTVLYEFPECDHGSMATPADAVLLEYLRNASDADAGMDASVPAVKK